MKTNPAQLTFIDGSDLLSPPCNATDTSRAAAASMAVKAPVQRQRVFDAIRAAGGLTNYEIEAACKIPVQSVCGRVNELKTLGKVKDSGRRKLSPWGKAAIVWVTT